MSVIPTRPHEHEAPDEHDISVSTSETPVVPVPGAPGEADTDAPRAPKAQARKAARGPSGAARAKRGATRAKRKVAALRRRRVLQLGLLAVVVGAASLIFVLDDESGVTAGVRAGTNLTPTGRLVVTEDGAVVDGMDVDGPIYVRADDVRITNSRVRYGGYHAIRIFSGVTGTVVEDTEIECTTPDRGWGIAFGRYAARRVEVNGCRTPFGTTGGNVTVTDSVVDGDEIDDFRLGQGRTSSVSMTVPSTTTTTAPPATTAPPTPTTARPAPTTTAPRGGGTPAPSGRVPAESAIIAEAGPTNTSIMRESGTITVRDEGAVIENVRVNGIISVEANNVTIRNCDVRGFSDQAVIRTVSGITGTRIEHCYLEAHAGPTGRPPLGTVSGGRDIYVGYSELTGFSDGIKAEHGSTYENNYIHTYKPSGSDAHIDGIQGSGRSNFTIRNNVIDIPASAGGNAAIFVQSFNGQRDYNITNVNVEGNYVSGGNITVSLLGAGYMSDFTYVNNRFSREGQRYDYSRVSNCGAVDSSGNVFKDDGAPVPGTC